MNLIEIRISSIAKKRLEKIFTNPDHESILEQMTEGHIFETWVELTAREVAGLQLKNWSPRSVGIFIDESTKHYADSFMGALAGKG